MKWFRKLWTRKSLDVLSDEATGHNKMNRALSAPDLVMLGIGAIIGSGIFVLSGKVAADNAGPSVILSFVIAGVASAFAGLCYAEIASMIPVSGSAYTYTIATMGELPGWIIGWDLILEYLVSVSAVAVSFSAYFQAFVKDAFGAVLPESIRQSAVAYKFQKETGHPSFTWQPGGIDLIAFLFTWIVTICLLFGVKESARVNGTVVTFKVAVLLVVICATMAFVKSENLTPFIPPNEGSFGKYGVSGILQGATIIFFAYIGFDAVSTTAQEARNPQRDLPIGILGSLVICTALYILMAVILVGLQPYVNYSGRADPITFAIQSLGPTWRWLSIIVSLAALSGLTSVALVNLMGQSRIFYSMANDGLLPKVFSAIHPKYKTPWTTTILSGLAVSLAAGFLPIDVLAELTSVGTLFAFCLVSIAVAILRWKKPNLERKFRVPGGYAIPVLSFCCSGLLIATATVGTLCRLLIWLAIGMIIYVSYGRRYSKLNHPEYSEDEKAPDFMEGKGLEQPLPLQSFT